VKGLGTTNDITVGGDVSVSDGGGKVTGKWNNLKYQGGSLTGNVKVKFDIPQLQLPDLEFQVLPGWKIHGNAPELSASLNLGGDLGALNALNIHVAVSDTDITNLPNALGDITAKAATLQVPKFASFGSVENLDVKIPGKGGSYDFGAATGSAALKITKF